MGLILFTAANKFYSALAGGIFLLVYFIIWIICLVRTLFSGQESRLQKEYGSDADIRKEKRQKQNVVLLTVSGVIFLGCVLAYIFLM